MRTRKVLSVLLAMTMLLSMFTGIPVSAAEGESSYTIIAYDNADSENKTPLTGATITIANDNVVTDASTVATSSTGTLTTSDSVIDVSDEKAYYVSVSCEGYEEKVFTLTSDTMDVWFNDNNTCYVGLAKHINYYIGAVSSNQESIASDVTVELKRADTEQEETLEYNDGTASGTCAEGVQYILTMSAEGYKTVNYTFTAGTADTETTGIQHVEAPEDAGLTGYAIIATLEADNGESEKTHSHPVCGATCDGDCGVDANTHQNIEWIAVTQEAITAAAGDRFFTEGNNYYLTEDIDCSGLDGGGWSNTIMIEADIMSICLNGHTMTVPEGPDTFASIHIKAQDYEGYNPDVYACFNLCDCVGGGELTIAQDDDDSDPGEGAIWLEDNSDMNIYNAKVTTNIDNTLIMGGYYGKGLHMYNGHIEHKKDDEKAFDGDIRLNGTSTVIGSVDGTVRISGNPSIDGMVRTWSAVNITGTITLNSPIELFFCEYDDETEDYVVSAGDFTNGWSTYMSEANPTDYFTDASGTYTAQKNPTTGELYFIRAYGVTVETNNEAAAEVVYIGRDAAPEGYNNYIEIYLNENYAVESVTATYGTEETLLEVKKAEDADIYYFTMPADDVTVNVKYKETPWYSVNSNHDGEQGNVWLTPNKAPEGKKIDVEVYENEGFVIDSISAYYGEENTAIELTQDSVNGSKYTFTMPAADVTLNVAFKEATYYDITENFGENGWGYISKSSAPEGKTININAYPDEGYTAVVSVAQTDDSTQVVATSSYVNEYGDKVYTFAMPAAAVTVTVTFEETVKNNINISSNFIGGTVTADKETAAEGEDVVLTATPVSGYELSKLTVTDTNNNVTTVYDKEAAVMLLALSSDYTFTMPASDVTVDATFTKKTIESPFTVKAVVNASTTDVDKDDAVTEATADMDVHSGDKVYVDVIVDGANYMNADWTFVYDYGKFKYVETQQNTAYETLGYYNHDISRVDGGIIKGSIIDQVGKTENLDRFAEDVAVVTYVFEALPKSEPVTGRFSISEAHANTCEMAGIQNNTPAATDSVDVSIVLIEDNDGDETTTPAGTFADETVIYNALEQSGNKFVLDAQFEGATVTYAVYEDGKEIIDVGGDGDVDTDDIATLDFRTGLPAWTNVGTYTYYAKVSGNGLATIYDSAVLTINPATLTPSANFAVDPNVNKVTITPVLEGVLDRTHTGTVTLTYTDENGNTVTTDPINTATFTYDGESTSVGTPIEVKAQKSGTFTVEIVYTAGVADEATGKAADNYTGGTNTASVDVDKLTFDDVEALEDTLTSVFPYNSQEHRVVIDEDALDAITDGDWSATIVDAYDETDTDPTVTNVGDEKLVKVVFKDESGVYNDVVVYVVLKVTPADVRITIADHKKAVGEEDPLPFNYTLEVLGEDADGDGEKDVLLTNELYSADDLTALDIELVRDPGEAAGTYTITATYVPNANYNVTVIDGKLEIGAPSTEGETAQVKIEVVDLSQGGTIATDETPDYIAGKRLILVYTDLDKAYYGYGENEATAERLFDVTAAGYNYVENFYGNDENPTASFTPDAYEYEHVYGIVVDALPGIDDATKNYEASEAYEALYRKNVIFLGSDAADAPENIDYDADINLTGELDINDYSMTNGIYNAAYERRAYIRSILKADNNGNKVVDTDDSLAVKGIVDVAVTE